ncbi:hypothetical protein ACJX0J_004005 [Zea mays]
MQKDERNIVFPERKTRGFLSSIFLFGIAALATSMIDTHQYIIEKVRFFLILTFLNLKKKNKYIVKKEDLEYIQIQYLYKIFQFFFRNFIILMLYHIAFFL